MAAQWTIVGGGDKGGILVREGQKLDSEACKERLATGSVIEEVELAGERLSYKLVTGSGPEVGWISLKVKGKDMAVKIEKIKYLGYELEAEKEEKWAVGRNGAPLSVKLSMPVDQDEKVPCCAIFIPGMPQPEFGNGRCEDPLPNAIMKKCWELGLPTLRFNYTGYGNSKGEPMALDDGTTGPSDFKGVLDRVLRGYCEKVAILAFSAGNVMTAFPAAPELKQNCLAYANINHGARSVAMVSKDSDAIMNTPPEEFYKNNIDNIASLGEIPHLYIKSEKDWTTPEADSRWMMDVQSKAAGSKASAEFMLLPGKHAFEGGTEGPPAKALQDFLAKVLA